MSSAARGKPHPATVADLLAIPEERRWHEIVDGELVEKASPGFEHGDANGRIYHGLFPFNRRPGGRWPGGWWFAIDVEIDFGPGEVYRPDVAGWRRERVPERPSGWPIPILPDWVCEILSSNRRNDLVKKKRTYHRRQVPHYWIVDPIAETLSVHRFTPDGYTEVLTALRGERVRAEPFDAIELAVGVFFGDDEEE